MARVKSHEAREVLGRERKDLAVVVVRVWVIFGSFGVVSLSDPLTIIAARIQVKLFPQLF
jgi:hypothetical protein